MADFNIGLGISFDAMPLSPVHEGMLSNGAQSYQQQNRGVPLVGRPPAPRQQLRRRTSDQERRQGPYQHRQVQSVVLPQGKFGLELDAFAGSVSSMPRQGPFQPQQHTQTQHGRRPGAYTHSAPTTPLTGSGRFFTQSNPASVHHSPQMELEGELDNLRRTMTAPRSHNVRSATHRMQPPPPQPAFAPYEPAGFDGGFVGRDTYEEDNSSYYATPVMSTPYSDVGAFVPQQQQFYPSHEYLNSSSSLSVNAVQSPMAYATPQLLASPVFDVEERRGYFDDADDMPEEPYVPTVRTQWPPTRPKLLARTTSATDDSRVFDSNPPSYNSPLSTPEDEFGQSATSNPSKEKKVAYSRWTVDEDRLLREAIVKFGDGKWSLISQCVPGRTPMQCSTRWQGALNTSIHKGKWEPDEDAILVKAVAEWQIWHARDVAVNGGQDIAHMTDDDLTRAIPWGQIAGMLPRPRTGVQALARWSEALDPRITKGKWTVEEDMALMRGIARHGKCWIKIAQGVQGRTQRQCRTRYCQIADKKRKANVATTSSAAAAAAAAAAASIGVKPAHARSKSLKSARPSPREFAIHSE